MSMLLRTELIKKPITSIRFQESVHNYTGIRDARQFSSAAADYFMGKKKDDSNLEYNPWNWENECWKIKVPFNVFDDFPNIEFWQVNLASTQLNLCFCHMSDITVKRGDTSVQNNNKLKNNSNVKNSISVLEDSNNFEDNHGDDCQISTSSNTSQITNQEYTVGNVQNQSVNSAVTGHFEGEGIPYVGKFGRPSFETMRARFPETPTNIFISEAVRDIEMSLGVFMHDKIPLLNESKLYCDNKNSFYQLLQILSSTSEEHHYLVCTALHFLPTKENQLIRQISNLNDAIRLIRHHSTSPRKDVAYILIGEKSFDNSQGSHKYKYSVD